MSRWADVDLSMARDIESLLERKGPLTLDEIVQELNECTHGKYTEEEYKRTKRAFTYLLYHEDKIVPTLDRRFELK